MVIELPAINEKTIKLDRKIIFIKEYTFPREGKSRSFKKPPPVNMYH